MTSNRLILGNELVLFAMSEGLSGISQWSFIVVIVMWLPVLKSAAFAPLVSI